jgi:hypothetical protein
LIRPLRAAKLSLARRFLLAYNVIRLLMAQAAHSATGRYAAFNTGGGEVRACLPAPLTSTRPLEWPAQVYELRWNAGINAPFGLCRGEHTDRWIPPSMRSKDG